MRLVHGRQVGIDLRADIVVVIRRGADAAGTLDQKRGVADEGDGDLVGRQCYGNNGYCRIRQIAIDDVQVGPADAARENSDEDLSRAWLGRVDVDSIEPSRGYAR